MDKCLWRGRGRDLGGACPNSRRGLRLRRRGAYGIHRASGPWCQGLCRKVASLRSGGRRLAVRKTIEYQIGALPRTPFPAAREFPSRGNERYEEKNRGVICFRYHFGVFPLWWLAPPPCPVGIVSLDSRVAELPYESSSFATPSSRGHYQAPLCCELLMKGLLFRALFCPLNRGKSGAARIGGGGERSEPITRMLILPYDTEKQIP